MTRTVPASHRLDDLARTANPHPSPDCRVGWVLERWKGVVVMDKIWPGNTHLDSCKTDMVGVETMARMRISELEKENKRLREAMREAWGDLACADTQSLESDDQIIMGHVRAAAAILRAALRL